MSFNYFQGKKILIIGGTGSVGEILVKNILKYNPKKITLIGRDETKHQRILDIHDPLEERINCVIADVRDVDSIASYYHNQDIAIHAAAMKHVKYCEKFKSETFKTNILGLKNSLDMAVKNRIHDFVFISSDKAADPTTYYGETKKEGEKMIANYAKTNCFRYVSVRLGNVLGARNSVLPRIKHKIDNNLPITVSRDTRFIMTKTDVYNLVEYALVHKSEGFIFAKQMESVNVFDLIDTFVGLYGSSDGLSESQTYSSISNEKKHEQIFAKKEIDRVRTANGYHVVTAKKLGYKKLKNNSNEKPYIDRKILSEKIKDCLYEYA